MCEQISTVPSSIGEAMVSQNLELAGEVGKKRENERMCERLY